MGLALCSRGTLGKGTLRTYPPLRVPTDSTTKGVIVKKNTQKATKKTGECKSRMKMSVMGSRTKDISRDSKDEPPRNRQRMTL